jgi:hypothetical protein
MKEEKREKKNYIREMNFKKGNLHEKLKKAKKLFVSLGTKNNGFTHSEHKSRDRSSRE